MIVRLDIFCCLVNLILSSNMGQLQKEKVKQGDLDLKTLSTYFSVIGLNFDFLSLNIVGFTLYGCYNVALFWISSVQDQYRDRYPMGVIPVQANDVFFPLHAVFACAVTIIQCFMYEVGHH